MLEELGISLGTAIVVLIALYFIIKWGVKNGIKDYFKENALAVQSQKLADGKFESTAEVKGNK